jgi:hypothetical protein
MSVYTFDGESYAGWKPVGRWFALAGVVALAVGAFGYSLSHSPTTFSRAYSDQMFSVAAEYIGFGLFAVMVLAAWGSMLVSRSERGSIEVNWAGVRRIFEPGHEEFFPREQMAGFVPRLQGGVVLVDLENTRQMLIPRGIDGYRDCIAELKAMGLQALPTSHLKQAPKSRTKALTKWMLIFLSGTVWSFFFKNEGTRLFHHLAGLAIVAEILIGIEIDARRTGKYSWVGWTIAAAIVVAVVWRW